MIKDRGSLKWTSMMLPEHVKQLREWEQEDTGEAEADHEWDEQLMEEMNRQILFAMEEATRVEIRCQSGAFAGQQVRGCIHFYDPYRRMLRMVDDEGGRQDVFLKSVAAIILL